MKAFDRVSHSYLRETLQHMNFGTATIQRIQETLFGDGTQKEKALIAWWKFALKKEDGGLSWTPIKDKVIALQMRNVSHILENKGCEWVDLVKSMLRSQLSKGANKKERRYWSPQEALLLLTQLRIPKAPVLSRMPKNWFIVRKRLKRNGSPQEVPVTFSIQQLVQLACLYTNDGKEWVPIAVRMLAALKITESIHLRTQEGGWKSIITLGFIHRKEWLAVELWCARLWDRWMRSQKPVNKPLQDAVGCQWLNTEEGNFTWKRSTKFWTNFLYAQTPLADELNPRWLTKDREDVWKRRWRNIWRNKLSYRTKIWWWKIYHKGFFTGRHAARINVDTGICHNCRREVETINHLW
ncbi:hypothetical protein R1sor_024444 [Riccia sorocarpa]|uniref:Reverse transcriptase domain-containing protein n=1 Tax=Riccia sorocarpa TaxID=122646 RepID=A0ABD3GRB2_9MARC